MITPVDLLGDLHDFLFLQGLSHLHQLACHPILAGMVDIAHRAQAHDVVPLQAFRKHLKGLRLVMHLCQLVGMVAVRNADQNAIAIGIDVPDIKIASGWDQAAVIIVGSAIQSVIIGISFSAGLQKLHLVFESQASEHVDGILDAGFMATKLDVVGHDSPHPHPKGSNVVAIEVFPVAFLDTVIETFRDRMLHAQLTAWE